MSKKKKKEFSVNRTCDGCTACCDGWLYGSAHGYEFYPGRKCHFVGSDGCSIYKDRPKSPCKTYKCVWLTDGDIPQWMKPNLSNVIITERCWGEDDEGTYYEVLEMGKKIDSSVLSWLYDYQRESGICMSICVDGAWHNYGSEEFIEYRDS